jgi:FkbM family methyltransferase
MVRKILRSTITPRLFGKRRYQAFWERLHAWSLEGMHIGQWESIVDPGELWVLKFVSKYFQDRPEASDAVNGTGALVFDVGANTGLYSLEVLRFFGNHTLLYSFEPSPSTYNLLKNSLEQFQNVECINIGLSDIEKTTTLYSLIADPCLASVYDRFRFHDVGIGDAQSRSSEQVSLRTIDAFCKERDITKIDFLKVDVEGHELEVLLGARTLIQNKAIDFIQFEFGGTDVDSKTFLHDFFQLLHPNFAIYRIVRDGMVPVEPYNERHEIFLYANYLAILRDLQLIP